MLKSILLALTLAFTSLAAFAGPVNINTAGAVELADNLNGVGEKKALLIVERRESVGKFTSAEQLLEVKGIGEKTLIKNKENILLGR